MRGFFPSIDATPKESSTRRRSKDPLLVGVSMDGWKPRVTRMEAVSRHAEIIAIIFIFEDGDFLLEEGCRVFTPGRLLNNSECS